MVEIEIITSIFIAIGTVASASAASYFGIKNYSIIRAEQNDHNKQANILFYRNLRTQVKTLRYLIGNSAGRPLPWLNLYSKDTSIKAEGENYERQAKILAECAEKLLYFLPSQPVFTKEIKNDVEAIGKLLLELEGYLMHLSNFPIPIDEFEKIEGMEAYVKKMLEILSGIEKATSLIYSLIAPSKKKRTYNNKILP